MSFLNQLKSQAQEKQSHLGAQRQVLQEHIESTEFATRLTWRYFSDLCGQLNVLLPAGPKMAVDTRAPWPPLALSAFVYDARKKVFADREVYDYVSMGWRLAPQSGKPLPMSASANFPPELEKIERRLAAGNIRHERVNVRHPEKNTLKEVRFDFETEARGSVTVTVDHENVKLHFRLACLQGPEVHHVSLPAADINSSVLDELAKLIVGHPSTFL